MSTDQQIQSTNTFPLSDRLGGGQEKQCLPVTGFKIGPAERGIHHITKTAIEFEEARQSAAYWLTRWTAERHNERFLMRHVRALRACKRLTAELCTP